VGADKSLYQTKCNGRNQVTVFGAQRQPT